MPRNQILPTQFILINFWFQNRRISRKNFPLTSLSPCKKLICIITAFLSVSQWIIVIINLSTASILIFFFSSLWANILLEVWDICVQYPSRQVQPLCIKTCPTLSDPLKKLSFDQHELRSNNVRSLLNYVLKQVSDFHSHSRIHSVCENKHRLYRESWRT